MPFRLYALFTLCFTPAQAADQMDMAKRSVCAELQHHPAVSCPISGQVLFKPSSVAASRPTKDHPQAGERENGRHIQSRSLQLHCAFPLRLWSFSLVNTHSDQLALLWSSFFDRFLRYKHTQAVRPSNGPTKCVVQDRNCARIVGGPSFLVDTFSASECVWDSYASVVSLIRTQGKCETTLRIGS